MATCNDPSISPTSALNLELQLPTLQLHPSNAIAIAIAIALAVTVINADPRDISSSRYSAIDSNRKDPSDAGPRTDANSRPRAPKRRSISGPRRPSTPPGSPILSSPAAGEAINRSPGMEHAGALAALEPFLALSKSASGPRAAAELVARATSDPHTFFFAELLHTPQIQALAASPDHAPSLRLLRIFSHGLYADYHAARHALPPLSPPQELKLRQLSLVSLARHRAALEYPALQAALRLDSPRDVEDLAVTAINAGLLRATLDPARQVVRVAAIAPVRDIAPGAVPDLATALRAWAARCSETLADLDAQIAAVHDAAARRGADARARREKQDRVMAEVREADKKNGGGGGGGGAAAAGGGGGSHRDLDRLQPYARDALTRRGLNKRSILDSVKAAGEDSMDIDQPHLADDKSKRASKRKM